MLLNKILFVLSVDLSFFLSLYLAICCKPNDDKKNCFCLLVLIYYSLNGVCVI